MKNVQIKKGKVFEKKGVCFPKLIITPPIHPNNEKKKGKIILEGPSLKQVLLENKEKKIKLKIVPNKEEENSLPLKNQEYKIENNNKKEIQNNKINKNAVYLMKPMINNAKKTKYLYQPKAGNPNPNNKNIFINLKPNPIKIGVNRELQPLIIQRNYIHQIGVIQLDDNRVLSDSMKIRLKQRPPSNRNFIIQEAKRYAPTEPTNDYPDSIIKGFSYKEDPNIDCRKTMEDFHSIHLNLFPKDKNNQVSFFAIFDGHSGKDSAIYCQNNFHKAVIHCLQSTNFKIKESLANAFVTIDYQLKSVNNTQKSGTTATVVLMHNNTIYAANVGDTRCYIIEDNHLIKMTKDHTCKNPKEVKRILEMEGKVFNGRVYGDLELTRALGDFEYKEYGVTPHPTISKHEISPKDKFVIIASDGVWNVLKDNDILSMIKRQENSTAEELCDNIINSSMENYTKDNVSCIVIKL